MSDRAQLTAAQVISARDLTGEETSRHGRLLGWRASIPRSTEPSAVVVTGWPQASLSRKRPEATIRAAPPTSTDSIRSAVPLAVA